MRTRSTIDRSPQSLARVLVDACNALLLHAGLALQFLTVLPLPRVSLSAEGHESSSRPSMATALPWFPLVGALIGALLALTDRVLALAAVSLSVRSALVLIVAAGITGMLHLDGFIDCCDGLLGTRSIERRLAILRDSRVGAYGVVGGGLLMILRFAALSALVQPDVRLLALTLAPLLGRWCMVWAVVRYPYARPVGVGTPFAQATGRHLAAATVVAALLVVGASVVIGTPTPFAVLVRAALLVVAAVLVSRGMCGWMSRRLGGGLTGDTYGAINECVEVTVLILLPLLVTGTAHLAFR